MLCVSRRVLRRLAQVRLIARHVVYIVDEGVALVRVRLSGDEQLRYVLSAERLPAVVVKIQVEKQAEALFRLGGVENGAGAVYAQGM